MLAGVVVQREVLGGGGGRAGLWPGVPCMLAAGLRGACPCFVCEYVWL